MHQRLHHLEIFKVDVDEPVENPAEVGRLLFSTHGRRGQNLLRYEIGDLGRWIKDECKCGRKSPRFKLMGRTGDIFRAAGMFLNYAKIQELLNSKFKYHGELQIMLKKVGTEKSQKDHMLLKVDKNFLPDDLEIKNALCNNYADLSEVVIDEKSLEFSIERVEASEFMRSTSSGKLLHIIDRRSL